MVRSSAENKAAQKHIDENYKGLDLQIETCAYNFKFGAYFAFAQSGRSQDTAFSIYMDSFGNVLYDDYDNEVANNFTTFRRLDEELRKIADETICSKLDYDFENISFNFDKEFDLEKLTLDMKLDIHNPPMPLTVDVTLFSSDVSYGKIAEVAKSLESLLREQNIPVSQYCVRILPISDKPEDENQAASWINALTLSAFPASLMGGRQSSSGNGAV